MRAFLRHAIIGELHRQRVGAGGRRDDVTHNFNSASVKMQGLVAREPCEKRNSIGREGVTLVDGTHKTACDLDALKRTDDLYDVDIKGDGFVLVIYCDRGLAKRSGREIRRIDRNAVSSRDELRPTVTEGELKLYTGKINATVKLYLAIDANYFDVGDSKHGDRVGAFLCHAIVGELHRQRVGAGGCRVDGAQNVNSVSVKVQNLVAREPCEKRNSIGREGVTLVDGTHKTARDLDALKRTDDLYDVDLKENRFVLVLHCDGGLAEGCGRESRLIDRHAIRCCNELR